MTTHGFFLGPSCKAPWRFWPAVEFAGEFSSDDMRVSAVEMGQEAFFHSGGERGIYT
jgi:hypothetical protein